MLLLLVRGESGSVVIMVVEGEDLVMKFSHVLSVLVLGEQH